jgi:anthranilate phosphoribosyltransferase
VKAHLRKITKGQDLSRMESYALFEEIMSGQADPMQMAAVLAALATKGESVGEIVGAAQVMREKVSRVHCTADCIDTCGTGGDAISTFNVSTTAAIIAAAAGATVAKHGNNTHTRASGSAEVLACLGANLNADVATVERCLAQARFAFLYAVRLHPAMRFAAPVRNALGIRTVFNLLGPLTNPAGARRHVLGVNHEDLTEKLAWVLRELGAECAMVVHGLDGLCDLTITGYSKVSELSQGVVSTYLIAPESIGLRRGSLRDLLVDSPQASAEVVRNILDGRPGPQRDHAVLNAAAAVVVAGLAQDLSAGVQLAQHVLDTGKAKQTLELFLRLSNEAPA